MNKKSLYAALAVLALCSSGCTYRRAAGNQSYVSPGNANTAYNVRMTKPSVSGGAPYNTAASAGNYGYGSYAFTGSGYVVRSTLTSFKTNVSTACSLCDRIYSAADAGNWKSCRALKTLLDTSVSNSKLTSMSSNTVSAGAQNNLSSLMTRLGSAIQSKNTAETKKCVNQVVKQIYDMGNTYAPDSVSRVNALKYYARELMLSDDMASAKTSCGSLVKCWNGIRSSTSDTSLQKLVNSINYCINHNNLAGAKSYAKTLCNNPSLSGNRSTMGL